MAQLRENLVPILVVLSYVGLNTFIFRKRLFGRGRESAARKPRVSRAPTFRAVSRTEPPNPSLDMMPADSPTSGSAALDIESREHWVDELENLAEMHQQGILTSDEFASAKSRLLNGSRQ